MNNEQKLGIKVFYYYLSKRVIAGLLLFLVSLFVSSYKSLIVSKLITIFSLNNSIDIFNYITSALYLIFVLFIIVGVVMSWLDYISCNFTLDENAFIIRRGILNKKEVSIPYRQIQDIDIEQTFNNKMLGVSKLVVLTAGNDDNDKEGESEGIFEVIDSKVAEQLRDDLLQRANIQTVKEVRVA